MPLFYYAEPNGSPQGPLHWPALRKLRDTGIISDDTYVIVEGAVRWQPYREVLTAQEGAGVVHAVNQKMQRIHDRVEWLVEKLLKWPWRQHDGEHLRRQLRTLNHFTMAAVTLLLLFMAVVTIIMGFRFDSPYSMLVGVAMVPAALLLQYVSSLFADANLRLAFGAPIPLLSALVPRVFALGSLCLSLALVVTGVFSAFHSFKVSLWLGFFVLGVSLGFAFFFLHLARLTAHPRQLMGVEWRPDGSQGSADYLFNIVRFSGRLLLLLLPVGTALGALLLSVVGVVFVVGAVMTSHYFLNDLFSAGTLRGLTSMGPLGTPELMILGSFGAATGYYIFLPVIGPMIGHFAYLLMTAGAEIGSGFFRIVENLQQLAARPSPTLPDHAAKP